MASGPELRNPQLTDALQTGDMAAIAFALRHGPTVVPLVREGEDGFADDDVWTYADAGTPGRALLLFSDASFRPATVPPDAALATPARLRSFLVAQRDDIDAVFLDFAGPHPLRAAPADLLAALDA
jgi:hypothetical protein